MLDDRFDLRKKEIIALEKNGEYFKLIRGY